MAATTRGHKISNVACDRTDPVYLDFICGVHPQSPIGFKPVSGLFKGGRTSRLVVGLHRGGEVTYRCTRYRRWGGFAEGAEDAGRADATGWVGPR